MTILSGVTNPSSFGGYNPYKNTDIEAIPAVNPLSFVAPPVPGVGGVTDTQPVSESPRALSGCVMVSFGDDFYNTIHITPNPADLGNVSGGEQLSINVWNAYFTNQLLASITETDTTGLTLTNAKTPPYAFLPLENRVYTLTALTEGPASIDAEYLFDFPTDNPVLSVVGFRAIVFPFRPNWRRPLLERLEWLTDILTAYDGSEQRIGLREVPRRMFEFEVLVKSREQQQLKAMLWNWVSRAFAIPVWTDGVGIDNAQVIGDQLIDVDTTLSDFVVDGRALLFSDEQTWELVTLTAVTDVSVTTKETLTKNWPAGTTLYPIRACRLLSKTGLKRYTADMAYGVFQFSVFEDSDFAESDFAQTYLGYPVFEQRPNWAHDITDDYERKMSVFDVGTLRPLISDESNISTLYQKQSWLRKSKSEIKTLRQYLYARRGRLNPVWLPTWSRDLTLALPFNAADTELHIVEIGFTKHYGAIGKRDIRIELNDGSIFYRRVSSPIDNGDGTEKISIDTALGVDVTPADIKLLCFMSLAVQNADSAEFSWLTPAIGEIEQTFRSVQDDV